MMVLVTYDVDTTTPAGKRRLRHVAKICENHGQRVQFSVFECLVDPGLWVKMKAQLVNEIKGGHGSLRFYFLGKNWRHRVEHVGTKPAYDPDGPLIL